MGGLLVLLGVSGVVLRLLRGSSVLGLLLVLGGLPIGLLGGGVLGGQLLVLEGRLCVLLWGPLVDGLLLGSLLHRGLLVLLLVLRGGLLQLLLGSSRGPLLLADLSELPASSLFEAVFLCQLLVLRRASGEG